MKHSKHNSLGRLTQKICSDICRSIRHYLFLEAPSFPRATLFGKNNFRGKIFQHIFAPNGGHCLNNLYDNTNATLKNFDIYTQFKILVFRLFWLRGKIWPLFENLKGIFNAMGQSCANVVSA